MFLEKAVSQKYPLPLDLLSCARCLICLAMILHSEWQYGATGTFFTKDGHDPNITLSISTAFLTSPQIRAALPLLLLCCRNRR